MEDTHQLRWMHVLVVRYRECVVAHAAPLLHDADEPKGKAIDATV